MGISFGGFAVYGLLTLTKRFHAALSVSGIADFAALYGSIDPDVRHHSRTEVSTFSMYLTEFGQAQLWGAPWERTKVYIANSPFFHLEHISTPLLIVQGDQDRIPVSQGERMFEGLTRLGKRVELVRYWGEGHTIEGRFNQADLNSRALAWFTSQLAPGSEPGAADGDQRQKTGHSGEQ
jgi:dipeptidyl aminopeptidase/acylaminoacyl peptidase